MEQNKVEALARLFVSVGDLAKLGQLRLDENNARIVTQCCRDGADFVKMAERLINVRTAVEGRLVLRDAGQLMSRYAKDAPNPLMNTDDLAGEQVIDLCKKTAISLTQTAELGMEVVTTLLKHGNER